MTTNPTTLLRFMRSETYSTSISGSPSYYDIWKAVRKQTVRKIVDWDHDHLQEYLNTLLERDGDLPFLLEKVDAMGVWIWNRMRNMGYKMHNHDACYQVRHHLISSDMREYDISSCDNCSNVSYTEEQTYVDGDECVCED